MKKFVMVLSGLFAIARAAYCQLPVSTMSSSNVSATVLTFVNDKDRQYNIDVALTYDAQINRKWMYKTEVSSFQRIYPHAVAFVSRGNNVFTEVSFERTSKKGHQITLSGFFNWDRESFAMVTQILLGKTTFHLPNSSTLVAGVESRTDVVSSPFKLKVGVEIPSNNYRFQTLNLSYYDCSRKTAAIYVEGYAGNYYDFSRYTLRIGERLKISDRVSGFIDVELNKVVEEKSVNGSLTRMKVDWKLNRKFSYGFMGIHNSYNGMFALMSSLQYRAGRHTLKTEYRNLRDRSFHFIETANAWFCSRMLFQYAYHFTKVTGNKEL